MTKLEKIKLRVEEEFCLPDIEKKSRKQEIIIARSFYYEIAVRSSRISLQKIARRLNKNHATLLNSRKELKNYLFNYPIYRESFNNLCMEFNVATDRQLEEIRANDQKQIMEEHLAEFKGSLPAFSDYHNLLELVLQTPKEHIETMEFRIKPILSMLPSVSKN